MQVHTTIQPGEQTLFDVAIVHTLEWVAKHVLRMRIMPVRLLLFLCVFVVRRGL